MCAFLRLISIDPSKPLPHEHDGEPSKLDGIQQLQATISLNDTKPETLSTEFTHNHSDHAYMETTTSAFVNSDSGSHSADDTHDTTISDQIEVVDQNHADVTDTIDDDQNQALSYPNETLDKGPKSEESETEKVSSGGNDKMN